MRSVALKSYAIHQRFQGLLVFRHVFIDKTYFSPSEDFFIQILQKRNRDNVFPLGPIDFVSCLLQLTYSSLHIIADREQ